MQKPKPKRAVKRELVKKLRKAKRKRKIKLPSERVLRANRELLEDMATLIRPSFLGPELGARLAGIAAKRDVPFWQVLREAVLHYIESEFVTPTTSAKDEALYPPTDNPLEEGVLPKARPRCTRCGVVARATTVPEGKSFAVPVCEIYPKCAPFAMAQMVPPPVRPHPGVDPVHHDERGWWFWDETWAARNGPYPDELTARSEFKTYCDSLDQPKPEAAGVQG